MLNQNFYRGWHVRVRREDGSETVRPAQPDPNGLVSAAIGPVLYYARPIAVRA